MRFRVAKLGGSLLDLPDLSDRLRNWLSSELSVPTLMVVGGGPLVDTIRDLDQIHHFDPVWCHWHCVELLSQTASLAHKLLRAASELSLETPPIELLASRQEFESFVTSPEVAPPVTLVQVNAFYTRSDNAQLPETWDTTSDSIAAYLARQVKASELVLLKSTGLRERQAASVEEFQHWQQDGLVDRSFYAAASGIPLVRLINLRNHWKSLKC